MVSAVEPPLLSRLQLDDDLFGSDLPGFDLSGGSDSDFSVQSMCSNSDEEQDELLWSEERDDEFFEDDIDDGNVNGRKK